MWTSQDVHTRTWIRLENSFLVIKFDFKEKEYLGIFRAMTKTSLWHKN